MCFPEFFCVLLLEKREHYIEVTCDKLLSIYGGVCLWCVYGAMSVMVASRLMGVTE